MASLVLNKIFSKIMIQRRKKEPSFVRNLGKVSYTYQEAGIYGLFMNECRLEAWRYALEKFHIDRDDIVDVGCSHGSWAENYRTLGFKRLLGIDPNPEVVEKAKSVFDEVHCAYAWDLKKVFPKNKTIAANGVMVHVIEDDHSIAFLSDISECLEDNGYFMYSVINAEFYVSSGRREWKGSESCVRFLATHRKFAQEANLEVVGEIGTFIDPWAISDLEYLVHNDEFRSRWSSYQVFVDLSRLLRGLSTSPFSEVLFVTQRRS